ncbi:MAG: ABC transporter substrate-binding protein [Flavobacterium sp.]|nr:ABC transporter substrate-binding protein [Pedobacter sp.]
MQITTFIDQMGRDVSIPFPPRRIISLVPSQTELLFDLGLNNEIAGITRFCIHPSDGYKTKIKVGGTKKVNLNVIRNLNPDLIIGNKEENDEEQVRKLMEEFTVWMSDIKDLNGALQMISEVGKITRKHQKAEEIIKDIENGFRDLQQQNLNTSCRIAYFIWKDPYIVAGTETFIHDILIRSGWKNTVLTKRYPELRMKEIKSLKPDRIFLSSEPYPFKEKHIAEFREIYPNAKVLLVDGEMFSWYGSRLLKAPAYLQTLLEDAG